MDCHWATPCHLESFKDIFKVLNEEITFCPLWGSRDRIGHENAQGRLDSRGSLNLLEVSSPGWISTPLAPSCSNSTASLIACMPCGLTSCAVLGACRTGQAPLMIGSACPGFHDFYEEGGAQHGYQYLKHNHGHSTQGVILSLLSHKKARSC